MDRKKIALQILFDLKKEDLKFTREQDIDYIYIGDQTCENRLIRWITNKQNLKIIEGFKKQDIKTCLMIPPLIKEKNFKTIVQKIKKNISLIDYVLTADHGFADKLKSKIKFIYYGDITNKYTEKILKEKGFKRFRQFDAKIKSSHKFRPAMKKDVLIYGKQFLNFSTFCLWCSKICKYECIKKKKDFKQENISLIGKCIISNIIFDASNDIKKINDADTLILDTQIMNRQRFDYIIEKYR